jgi:muconolactone delta-isomerase
MQFLVIAEARDTIVGDAVRRLRQDVGKAVERITASGKLRAGGVLAGRRMPFFLLEVDSSEDLMELLGSELIDNMNCNVYPVASFEFLGRFFREHAV